MNIKYHNEIPTKILVLCEESGTVRRAFKNQGANYVWSCDLQDAEDNSPWHLKMDAFECLDYFETNKVKLDLIIMHPPCTALCVAGNSTYGEGKARYQERLDSVEWTVRLWNRAQEVATRVALENPIGVLQRLGTYLSLAMFILMSLDIWNKRKHAYTCIGCHLCCTQIT